MYAALQHKKRLTFHPGISFSVWEHFMPFVIVYAGRPSNQGENSSSKRGHPLSTSVVDHVNPGDPVQRGLFLPNRTSFFTFLEKWV